MQIVTGEFTLSSRERDVDVSIVWEVTYPDDVKGLRFVAAFKASTSELTTNAARLIKLKREADR